MMQGVKINRTGGGEQDSGSEKRRKKRWKRGKPRTSH